ncbi:MAG: hypothetical protein ABS882_00460 [Lysinibacillus sp.]
MFSNDELKAMIEGQVISDQYPYSEQSEEALKNYLKALQAELKREKLQCEVEADHFGSGYASYMQWFVYEQSGIEITEDPWKRTVDIQGLHILISRLAPVIVIGNGTQSSTYLREADAYLSGAQSVFSEPEDINVSTEFQALAQKLERLFMKYHFTILRQEDLQVPLPFVADIPTIWRDKHEPYLLFDTVFYWED